jgi:hypothetical protein
MNYSRMIGFTGEPDRRPLCMGAPMQGHSGGGGESSPEESSSSSLSPLSPSKQQHLAWSRHLQLPQHNPKCLMSHTHSGNGRSPRQEHSVHGPTATRPLDWIKRALMYEGRCVTTCWSVMAPRMKGTSHPGKAKTACCRLL